MTGLRAPLLEDDLVVAMMNEPTPTEREQAIQFLAGAIPKEALANVLMLMQNKQSPWHQAAHFGLGLRVRNALREAGYRWSDQYLDDHWHELVQATLLCTP
jgi:hypothetical protein